MKLQKVMAAVGVTVLAVIGGGGPVFRTPSAAAAVTYTVTVLTSDVEGAGTNGTVEVRLRGNDRTTGFIRLDDASDNFERDARESFELLLPDLGTLLAVDVRLTPQGSNAAWHLTGVGVDGSPTQPQGAMFPCHCWFTSSQQTTRFVQSALHPTGYVIYVNTSDIPGAGTNGKVEVRLHGDLASSGYMELDDSADNYERNRTDRFGRLLDRLGDVESVDVRFTALDSNAPWHLSHITVVSVDQDAQFLCNCWFNTSSTRTLQAV